MFKIKSGEPSKIDGYVITPEEYIEMQEDKKFIKWINLKLEKMLER